MIWKNSRLPTRHRITTPTTSRVGTIGSLWTSTPMKGSQRRAQGIEKASSLEKTDQGFKRKKSRFKSSFEHSTVNLKSEGDKWISLLFSINRPIEMLVTALNVAGDTGCGQVRERPGQSPLRDLRVKDHQNPTHDNRTDYREDGNTGIMVYSMSSVKAMSLCGSAAIVATLWSAPRPRRCVRSSPELFLSERREYFPYLAFRYSLLNVPRFVNSQLIIFMLNRVNLCCNLYNPVTLTQFQNSLQSPTFQFNCTIL